MFLLLVTIRATAETINDTIYYASREEVSYDTIPHMVKDQVFFNALNELLMMLNGDKPYSLKRAGFYC